MFGQNAAKMPIQLYLYRMAPLIAMQRKVMQFKFYAYEVLGPAFQTHSSYCDWKAEKTETETTIEIPEGMDCSNLLTAASGYEHLLEAVVANVFRGGADVKSEKSYCESVKSLLTVEEMPKPTCDKVL
ncbi:uncharacterized protein LOC130772493 isoform X2 [Actinidia eriantha]|uniref:uncharacterized protein LOC130772493 isoform X2 n=1 Tax=Actinidia eriantha TaxID=165200 RepID=UPI0025877569|nr:uncharacterized protein LOC130772493 isoform X2 [Actinidia eriantha]